MKRFVFKYEKILQLRIDKELAVKNKLAKVNQLIIDKNKQLDATNQQNIDFLKSIDKSVEKGMYISDLQAIAANKTYMKQLLLKITKEIEIYEEERTLIQKELIEANKQRKVMEKLKEKDVKQYKDIEALEESKVIDQIVTYQSTKSRGDN